MERTRSRCRLCTAQMTMTCYLWLDRGCSACISTSIDDNDDIKMSATRSESAQRAATMRARARESCADGRSTRATRQPSQMSQTSLHTSQHTQTYSPEIVEWVVVTCRTDFLVTASLPSAVVQPSDTACRCVRSSAQRTDVNRLLLCFKELVAECQDYWDHLAAGEKVQMLWPAHLAACHFLL